MGETAKLRIRSVRCGKGLEKDGWQPREIPRRRRRIEASHAQVGKTCRRAMLASHSSLVWEREAAPCEASSVVAGDEGGFSKPSSNRFSRCLLS